jgi:hypothetical protein
VQESEVNDTTMPEDLPPFVSCDAGATPGSFRMRDLPADCYHHDLTRASCSMLKGMLLSPAHYLQNLYRQHVSSPAMQFGSLVHLLILEPHRLPQFYAVIPGSGRPGAAERREAQAFHPGRQILSEVQLHEARMAAERVMGRQVRGRPFQRFVEEGLPEATFYYDDPVTQVPCKVRMDLWHPDLIFDLKTTRHPQADAFTRACITLHYDLQAYMYCLADARFRGSDQAREFVFLGVQSEEPHPVHVMTAGSSFMANGEAKYVRAMSWLYACTAADHWPDNSTDGVLEVLPWQAFEAPGLAEGAAQPLDEDPAMEECGS